MARYGAILSLLIAVVTLNGCTVYGEHPAKTFSDATGGAGFEQGLWRDIQAQNWTDLDRHIAANFVYVTPAGRLERTAALEDFKRMRVLEYSLGDLTTEMTGDTFVVTYTITLRGSSASGGFPDRPERRMTVWQKEKSGWVAIAHSVLGTS